jgi:hypothetical protein
VVQREAGRAGGDFDKASSWIPLQKTDGNNRASGGTDMTCKPRTNGIADDAWTFVKKLDSAGQKAHVLNGTPELSSPGNDFQSRHLTPLLSIG